MLRRRSFLMASGCIVAGPAIAKLAGSSMTGDGESTHMAISPIPSTEALPSIGDDGSPVLRIAEWEVPGGSEPICERGAWIRIDHAWRATWR